MGRAALGICQNRDLRDYWIFRIGVVGAWLVNYAGRRARRAMAEARAGMAVVRGGNGGSWGENGGGS